MIFDSHAHYDDEAFNIDRNEVIENLRKNRVVGVLNCGSSMEGAIYSVKLAEKYDFFYAAVGLHPEYVGNFDETIIEKLEKLCLNYKVKAIGEIGLDYYYKENPSSEIQQEAFRKQMELAEKLNLPVVIHDRDAHADTLKILKEFPKVKGVIHCFSGSTEFARECLKIGYYIGFTGIVTFKNAKKIIEVAKEVPLNRMLVETDCPYMAPIPYRGKRNQSDYIKYIAAQLAEIKGIETNKILSITENNIRELLNLI